jgi:hypothetical protein
MLDTGFQMNDRSRRVGEPLRSSRLSLTLSSAALLASAALFAATLIVSFNILHDDNSDKAPPTLKSMTVAGPQTTVFDWSRDACDDVDIPDAPARAFRDAAGRVVLMASHFVSRRAIGPDLGHLTHQCKISMNSDYSSLPQDYDDKSWLASTYTKDGRTVFGLVHDEYQGNTHPGRCASGDYFKCWYNVITFARSDDSGLTFRRPAGPAKLVAAIPYRYEPDSGAHGLFEPSNIVYRQRDGYYYTIVRAGGFGDQKTGACLLRTRQLADPSSWRGWDGSDFGTRFIDPYRQSVPPQDHLCEPVGFGQIATMSSSLTWNTYLGQYLLVGPSTDYSPTDKRGITGFYYSVSPDLIRWSRRRLFREVVFPWKFGCGDRQPVAYPSVLDPNSKSRNFETTGRRPWLFFTRLHYAGCQQTMNRDLVRVPIELSK